jgi:uncharacterized protein (TIGR02996 family)
MTDADAFLEAIWAKPDDALPRLVYADWLDEHGESEYASLIRLGHEIDRRDPLHPVERRALRRSRYELVSRLQERWGELAPGVHADAVVDHSGRPTRDLRFDTAAFLGWDGPRPFFLPTRRLILSDYFGLERQLGECRRLTEVSHLRFVGAAFQRPEPPHPPVSDPLLAALASGGCFSGVEDFTIQDLCPSRRGLADFAATTFVARLRALAFDFPTDAYHHWIDVSAAQPPAGRIRAAIDGFLTEYGGLLPET